MGNMMNDNFGYDRMVAWWTIISEGQLFDWRITVLIFFSIIPLNNTDVDTINIILSSDTPSKYHFY